MSRGSRAKRCTCTGPIAFRFDSSPALSDTLSLMTFVAPIWLLGLVPWAAVTLWLLWGRRKKEPVPFLPLWQGAEGKMRVQQSMQTPPIALAAAILAMLMALLAAARPTARRS